jgi:hypothetical protein
VIPFSFWKATAGGGGGGFDPGASMSLTGWWRANSTTGYVAGTWDGVASLGSSGSRDLTEATNPPSTGTTINGHTAPDFDGSNDRLANGTAISTMLTGSAWLGWWLVYIDAIATNSGTSYQNDVVMDDSGAFWGIFVRANGGSPLVYAYQWDGAEKAASASIATGAWQLIMARYDGTNIRLKVNSGSIVTAAAGSISTTTGTIRCGYNGATAFNGRMADVGLVAGATGDSDFDDIKSYVNTRYGLSL